MFYLNFIEKGKYRIVVNISGLGVSLWVFRSRNEALHLAEETLVQARRHPGYNAPLYSVGDHWGPIISLTLVEVLERTTVDKAQSLCLMRQLTVPMNPEKRAVQLLFSEDSGRTENACFFLSHAFSFTFNFIRDGLHGISAKQSDTTNQETLLIGLTQASVF